MFDMMMTMMMMIGMGSLEDQGFGAFHPSFGGLEPPLRLTWKVKNNHICISYSSRELNNVRQVKKKVKRTILHLERRWGAHLPFYGREPVGG